MTAPGPHHDMSDPYLNRTVLKLLTGYNICKFWEIGDFPDFVSKFTGSGSPLEVTAPGPQDVISDPYLNRTVLKLLSGYNICNFWEIGDFLNFVSKFTGSGSPLEVTAPGPQHDISDPYLNRTVLKLLSGFNIRNCWDMVNIWIPVGKFTGSGSPTRHF